MSVMNLLKKHEEMSFEEMVQSFGSDDNDNTPELLLEIHALMGQGIIQKYKGKDGVNYYKLIN